MNSKDFLQTLRKVIREEVQVAVRSEFTKFSHALNESKPATQDTSYTQTMKRKPVTKKQFTSNSSLNDLLNETSGFSKQELNYNDFEEWPTMSMGAFGSNSTPKASVIPTVDLAGNRVDANNLPDDVVSALTKDYSALMKAIDKKKGK
jgi:hypothetical protein